MWQKVYHGRKDIYPASGAKREKSPGKALFVRIYGREAIKTDNQEKIRYLKRYTQLDREIDRKLNECERWRLRLGKITATITDMPMGGGSIFKNADADIINRIIDIERGMNDDIDILIVLKQEVEVVINAVDDNRSRELLRYRYINGFSFERIADRMGYAWRHIHRLHAKALGKVQITEDEYGNMETCSGI